MVYTKICQYDFQQRLQIHSSDIFKLFTEKQRKKPLDLHLGEYFLENLRNIDKKFFTYMCTGLHMRNFDKLFKIRLHI